MYPQFTSTLLSSRVVRQTQKLTIIEESHTTGTLKYAMYYQKMQIAEVACRVNCAPLVTWQGAPKNDRTYKHCLRVLALYLIGDLKLYSAFSYTY